MNGTVGVNKKSQVLSVSADEQTIAPYILTTELDLIIIIPSSPVAPTFLEPATCTLSGTNNSSRAGSVMGLQRLW